MAGGGRIGLGVCGLGRAFSLMLPTFARDERFRLVAATTPGAAARRQFESDFTAPTYDDLNALCADPNVEAVYIASPHQFHAAHVAVAARAGKHILVEKPLAVTLAEGARMVAAAQAGGVHLVVGPSHSFDAPVGHALEIVETGRLGPVRMIQALNYTDFLYRPRRPEELDTAQGGGVLFSQAVHQVDVVRLLGGGLVTSVRAQTGAWDPDRPTEGAYAAQLTFAGGAFASLVYSGYGHYDSDELMANVGELGHAKTDADYGKARRALASVAADDEAMAKRARNYGQPGSKPDLSGPFPDSHEHFGLVIVSCERGDLRLTPTGVWVFEDAAKRFEAVAPPAVPREAVMDALWSAVREDRPPIQTGAWGLASLEVCLNIAQSACEGRDIRPERQVAVRP